MSWPCCTVFDNHCIGSSYFFHIQSIHFLLSLVVINSFTWIFLLFIAVLVFLPLLRLLLQQKNRRQEVKEFSLPINLLDSSPTWFFFFSPWLTKWRCQMLDFFSLRIRNVTYFQQSLLFAHSFWMHSSSLKIFPKSCCMIPNIPSTHFPPT